VDAQKDKYESKLTTTADLARQFKPGDRILLGSWYGEPYGVMEAMAQYCGDVDPLYVSGTIYSGPAEFLDLAGVHNFTNFCGPRERQSQLNHQNVYFTPGQFTHFEGWACQGDPFDYFVHRVAPMDEAGNFSFSLTSSFEYETIQWIKANRPKTTIVFEVNPNLPRVYGLKQFGNNELSIDYPDVIVEDVRPIMDRAVEPPTKAAEGIAEIVATLIEDKATIQLGYGTIPMAIGKLLADRKELGVHTEMFCDAHIDLIEHGSITNAHKGLYDGISISTFALGTKRLHDWVRENKEFAILPVSEVNTASVLARVNQLVSVNSILTVDMTGQCCAHCLGPRTYSGMGGGFEFAHGAQLSPGGKSILCLPSTTILKDGTVVSNIVAQHAAGTRIAIPEHTVDWVATEYGAVKLKFLPLDQRGRALVDIAHPDFREGLMREMVDAGLRMDRLDELPKPPAQFFSRI